MAEDNSYYPGADDAGGPDASQKPADDKDEKADTNSALLPASIFGDKMPEVDGECKFRVVKVYGDEVEVEYVKEEKDDGKKRDNRPSMEEAEKKLGDMATMQGDE